MMRTDRIRAAFGAAILALAASPAFAADVRENRAVSGFTGIRLAVPAKLELVQGDAETFVIEGAAADVAQVQVAVEEGVLHIRSKSRVNWSWNPKLRITVNAKRVESLSISGSGDIAAKAVRSPALKMAISGSGDIRIPALETDSAVVAISGSGDVRLGGRAGTVTSHISGSGDLKAEQLEARNVTVSIAGSGDVSVWAREALQVRIAGSGDVRYYGDPSVDKTVLGSGSVRRLGPAPS